MTSLIDKHIPLIKKFSLPNCFAQALIDCDQCAMASTVIVRPLSMRYPSISSVAMAIQANRSILASTSGRHSRKRSCTKANFEIWRCLHILEVSICALDREMWLAFSCVFANASGEKVHITLEKKVERNYPRRTLTIQDRFQTPPLHRIDRILSLDTLLAHYSN